MKKLALAAALSVAATGAFAGSMEEPMVEEPVSLEPDKELNFFEKLFR